MTKLRPPFFIPVTATGMMMKKLLFYALYVLYVLALTPVFAMAETLTLRIATFNVSMEAGNYSDNEGGNEGGNESGDERSPEVLLRALAGGRNPQITHIASIIQTVRPDILLLNEFDYIGDRDKGVGAFLKNYLNVDRGGQKAIDYPHVFTAPVNTGVDSGRDLNRDGRTGTADDAWGFGHYPGQYGMVLLSRFPLELGEVRTFQHFRWQDMPGALRPLDPESGAPWYPADTWAAMPLSSKSHWDVPIRVDGTTLHLLASHPTPPVFDGPENRNGKRNHDEIRFWQDYIDPGAGHYIRDDNGRRGGLRRGERFVIAGDLNASPVEGDSYPGAIGQLLHSPYIDASLTPRSRGGAGARPDNPHATTHTAAWGMRADYVLPSRAGLTPLRGGVFWPAPGEPGAEWVTSRSQSSDHRLVWQDLALTARSGTANRD